MYWLYLKYLLDDGLNFIEINNVFYKLLFFFLFICNNVVEYV